MPFRGRDVHPATASHELGSLAGAWEEFGIAFRALVKLEKFIGWRTLSIELKIERLVLEMLKQSREKHHC